MTRYRRILLSLVLGLVPALAAAAPAPWPQGGPSHSCLAPSGDDDTAALQAALDRCAGAKGSCAVELCAGVFHTGILRVKDFRGTLEGQGPHSTVLRALPEIPVSGHAPDFYREDALSPSEDPWPYLVQLIGGRGSVRDLEIRVPAPPEGERPTTGWYFFDEPIFELRGALLLTGTDPVDFEVRDVRVEAESDPQSDLGTTLFYGISFEGLVFDPQAEEPYPVFPLQGRLRVADCELEGMLTGTTLYELSRAHALVDDNRYRTSIAVEVIDADRSYLSLLANHFDVNYRGFQVFQNLDGPPSRGSAILVNRNEGSLSPLFPGVGDGISFEDFAFPADEGTTLWVSANRVALGNPAGPATSGMSARGAARLRLVRNVLTGAAGAGIDVDETEGCLLWHNSFSHLSASLHDLGLGPSTSDCLAVVAPDDVVVDEGSANHVKTH
jgi:hypothetical protein